MDENIDENLPPSTKGNVERKSSKVENGIEIFEEEKVGLKRQVRLISLVAYLIGSIIGSGIFATTKSVAIYIGSSGGIFLVWIGGGVIAMMGALTWCELGGMFPNACGNKYTYISEAFGPFLGFLLIYMNIIIRPIEMCLICIVAGDHIVTAIVGEGDLSYIKLTAAIIIAINTAINCVGVKSGEWTQIVFTSLKLGAIAIIVVTGLVRLGQGHTGNFENAFNGSTTSVSDVGYALYGSMYSYSGWESLNSLSAESVDPIRHPPIATYIGIPVVIVCYIMVNVAYLTVFTPSQLAVSDAVAVTIANKYYGVMSWIIPVLVACSCFGTANSGLFFNARAVYEAANKGQLPQIFGTLHVKRCTPIPALLLNSLISLIILIPESTTFATLLIYISGILWASNAIAVAAMLWMRKSRANMIRPFKVFILVPILLFICSVFLVVAPFYSYPVKSSYGILVILPAFPLYFAFVKYQILPKVVYRKYQMIVDKLQRYCNLSLPSSENQDHHLNIYSTMS